MKPLCYLAGPIAGLKFDDATDWRNIAKYRLNDMEIETLNPMRAKMALESENQGVISRDFRDYEKFGHFFTSRGIMARDFNDVKRCDAALVNLLGATHPSYGTVMELAWLYAMQKPAVVAMEKDSALAKHPLITETLAFRVDTLDEAIESVAIVLNRF